MQTRFCNFLSCGIQVRGCQIRICIDFFKNDSDTQWKWLLVTKMSCIGQIAAIMTQKWAKIGPNMKPNPAGDQIKPLALLEKTWKLKNGLQIKVAKISAAHWTFMDQSATTVFFAGSTLVLLRRHFRSADSNWCSWHATAVLKNFFNSEQISWTFWLGVLLLNLMAFILLFL